MNVSCCGGKVVSRSGKVFCTRDPTSCGFKSHASDKHPVLPKRLYKKFQSGEKALLTGSITVEEVGADLDSLLKEKRTLVEWDAEFKNIRVRYPKSLDEALGSGDSSVRELWKELEEETRSPVIIRGPSPSSAKYKRARSKDSGEEGWTELKTVFDPDDYVAVARIPATPAGVGEEGWIKNNVPCALLCSMTRRLEILSLWSTSGRLVWPINWDS